ncbi:hypothetical protein HK1_02142 [Tepidibacillus sp. HK-1]|nr:hypothetical protein HK1_02142 [Tepidibacillus sp. HK-1]
MKLILLLIAFNFPLFDVICTLLIAIYPLAITFVFLSFIDKWFSGYSLKATKVTQSVYVL